jgi:hypothetical protein
MARLVGSLCLLGACQGSSTSEPSQAKAAVSAKLPPSCHNVWEKPGSAAPDSVPPAAAAAAPSTVVPADPQLVGRALAKLKELGQATGAAISDTHNQERDAVASQLLALGPVELETLARELEAELSLPQPSPLVLLEAGHVLFTKGTETQKRVAQRALFALDPNLPVVRGDVIGLFRFTHAIALAAPEGILRHLDRHCASTEGTTQGENMSADTTQCVFLYGAVGPSAEAHVAARARDLPAERLRALEILSWIGTDASVEAVKAAVLAQPSGDVVKRATAFFMRVGGEKGRAALLSLPLENNLEPATREYLVSSRERASKIDRQTLRAEIAAGFDAGEPVSDAQLCGQLQSFYDNFGHDRAVSPLTVLDSKLPRKFLVDQLVAIRRRMLQTPDENALDNVKMTNAILNVLQY